ncbi:hypothetical protein [Bacillus cereus]|uniref:hypothetical protein n=1 Tax=Bacillus cereus TaxID=1396 RepID=UPI003D97FDEA
MEAADKILFNTELNKRIAMKEEILKSNDVDDYEKEKIDWQISGMKLVSGMVNGLFASEKKNDKTMNSLKKYKVAFKDGKSEVVEGKVFLFSESAPQVPITNDLNLYNANLVQSIQEVHIEVCPNCDEPIEATDLYADGEAVANVKHCSGCGWSNGGRLINERTNHCDNKTSVAELPERYRGIKISETSLNIRNEIIKNDIDYLKDITPEQMELLVQLFEKEKSKEA